MSEIYIEVFNDLTSVANREPTLTILGVKSVQESAVGGWLIVCGKENYCLPKDSYIVCYPEES